MSDIFPYGISEVMVVSECGKYKAMICPEELTFEPVYNENEKKCGGKVVANSTCLEKMNFTLTGGGISLEAYAIMTGNATKVFEMADRSQARSILGSARCLPYVCLIGKSLGSSGFDDVWIKLPRVKLTGGPSGSFTQDEFFSSSYNGTAIADQYGNIFEITHHEKEQALDCNCWPECWGVISALNADCLLSDLSVGNSVAEWPNSGFGSVVASQPVAAARPTLDTTDNGDTCVRFDGTDDFMEAPFDPSTTNNGEWTIAASVIPDNVVSQQVVWAVNGNFFVQYNGSQLELQNGASTITGPAVNPGDEHNILVRYDGNVIQFWVNGTEYASSPTYPAVGIDDTIEIGRLTDVGARYLTG